MRRAAAAVVFAALAALSFSQAAGMIATRFSPAVALALYPRNGLAMAKVALALAVAKTVPGQAQDASLPDAKALALRAYRHEPLAYNAVSAAALVYAADDKHDRARKLMTESLALTRRDEAANIWLVQDSALQGNLAGVLKHIDLAQRTSRTAGAALNPVLVTALAQSASIAPFERLLASRPSWAEDFWLAALKNDAALENAARLRAALARRGDRTISETDQVLIQKLVHAGSYAPAFGLHAALADPRQIRATERFDAQPVLPPIDWDLLAQGELGANILPADKVLLISAAPGSSGTAARRLVRLQPGPHRIEIALRKAPEETQLHLGAACAKSDRNGSPLADETVMGSLTEVAFTAPAGCRYVWINLSVSVPEGAQAEDVIISRLQIDP